MLLISALLVGITGCGEKKQDLNAEEDKTVSISDSDSSKNDIKTEQQSVRTEEHSVQTEQQSAENEEQEIIIREFDSFDNGCMAFNIYDTEYIYRLTDQKLFQYNKNDVKLGKLLTASGNIAVYEDGIYNFVTGEVITSKDTDGGSPFYPSKYYLLKTCSYVPVYKIDEKLSGDINYFGIVDTNGDWLLPLSSEHEICSADFKYALDNYNWKFSSGSLIFFYDDYYYEDEPDRTVYDFKKNEFIKISEAPVSSTEICGVSKNSILVTGGDVYNVKTGEVSSININTAPW